MKQKAFFVLIAILILVLLVNNATADIVDPDPNRLLEAQLLALEVEGQLRPSAELTEQIYNDLATIRSAYPDVANITFWPRAVPDEIMIGVTQEAAEQFRNGQYHALDELNELYGVIEIRIHFHPPYSFLILKFNQVYNTQLLSQIYAEANLEGVRYVKPNHIIGDGPTIIAEPPIYIFIDAWGDCPSGCIYHEFWPFKVEGGQAVLCNEYYVDAVNGNDRNLGLTPQTAFATIQKGIDTAVDGDTIIVADGTYTGPGNRDIDFLGKAITVRSENGPDNCIIDCNGTKAEPHRGFYFHNSEDANSVVAGFTVTNGYAEYRGGGIYCRESSPKIRNCKLIGNLSDRQSGGIHCGLRSSPEITNCTITGNSAKYDGGGIYCNQSSPTITNCTISENSTTWEWSRGSGIFCRDSGSNISNCIIRSNSAGYGGGICCDDGSDLIINQCLISSNFSHYGGGIEGERSNMTISHCTIADNSVSDGGGGILCWKSNATISNSILWGNNAIRYGPEIALTNAPNPSHLVISNTDIKGGRAGIFTSSSKCTINWGHGNIDTDPCFVEPGHWDTNDTPADANDDFWIDGDYHLLPNSPCIDAGDPNYIPEPNETDLDGNPRVNGGRIDMGAYESVMHEARLWLWPRVINRKSHWPRTIMAWMYLPQGITRDQIDEDVPLILYPGGIKATQQFVFQNRRRCARRTSIFAFFDKTELMEAVETNGPVQLMVLGHLLKPGQYFYGSDTIRIIAPRPPRRPPHWPPHRRH